MAVIQIGQFAFDDGILSGPAAYMQARGNALVDAMLDHGDLIFNTHRASITKRRNGDPGASANRLRRLAGPQKSGGMASSRRSWSIVHHTANKRRFRTPGCSTRRYRRDRTASTGSG